MSEIYDQTSELLRNMTFLELDGITGIATSSPLTGVGLIIGFIQDYWPWYLAFCAILLVMNLLIRAKNKGNNRIRIK